MKLQINNYLVVQDCVFAREQALEVAQREPHALLLHAFEFLSLHDFVGREVVRFVLLVEFFDCEFVDMFHLHKF